MQWLRSLCFCLVILSPYKHINQECHDTVMMPYTDGIIVNVSLDPISQVTGPSCPLIRARGRVRLHVVTVVVIDVVEDVIQALVERA